MLQRYAANRRGRDFVVGDLHGCYDLLIYELDRLGFDRHQDRLFCVGDLIDRGPRSLDCLGLSFETWFHSVRGNHEMLAYHALAHGHWEPWLFNGGDWARSHAADWLRKRLDAALVRMPYAMEVDVGPERIGIVHAEPPRDWSRLSDANAASAHEMLWSRRRIARRDESIVQHIDVVVVGHTILEEPLWLGNVHYIDTGAFLSGRLTIRRLDELLPAPRGERR